MSEQAESPGARRRGPVRRILRFVGLALVALLTGVFLYIGHAHIRSHEDVSLPKPSGPHEVGRATFDWVDGGRVDVLALGHRRDRELSVWLWYPAAGGTGATARYTPGLWSGLHLPWVVGWGETDFADVTVHARQLASASPGRYPLVVLEPGLGFSAPQYQALAEDLASRGYVVAGVTPTYSANRTVVRGRVLASTQAGNPSDFSGAHTGKAAAAGDRLVGVWSADARFVAQRLAHHPPARLSHHVDATHVLYVGHSLGGAAALQACSDDRGCGGAVDLDGTQFGSVVSRGTDAPVMIVGHDGSCVTGTCSPRTAADRADVQVARRMLAHPRMPGWLVTVDGTEHFSFTDYSAYYLARPLRALIPVGSIDGRRALTVTRAYVGAFADEVVRHRRSPLLDEHGSTMHGVHVSRTP